MQLDALRQTVDLLPHVVCAKRRDGRFVIANRVAAEAYGVPAAEIEGCREEDLGRPDDEVAADARARRAVLSEPDRRHQGEERFTRKDGVTRVLRTTRVRFDVDGEPAVLLIGMDVTAEKDAAARLVTSEERLRRLAARQQAVREEERTAIAREIHDELGQRLTGLKLDLIWHKERLPSDDEQLLTRADVMVDHVDRMLDVVRQLSRRIRPALLDDLGLEAAIEWQVQDFEARTGLACDLALHAAGIAWDGDRDTAVFRILQEALTNIVRHAAATAVNVTFDVDGEEIRLVVDDDGCGIHAAALDDTDSLGLIGMRERALAHGGEISIGPGPRCGTRVSLRMPLVMSDDGS